MVFLAPLQSPFFFPTRVTYAIAIERRSIRTLHAAVYLTWPICGDKLATLRPCAHAQLRSEDEQEVKEFSAEVFLG